MRRALECLFSRLSSLPAFDTLHAHLRTSRRGCGVGEAAYLACVAEVAGRAAHSLCVRKESFGFSRVCICAAGGLPTLTLSSYLVCRSHTPHAHSAALAQRSPLLSKHSSTRGRCMKFLDIPALARCVSWRRREAGSPEVAGFPSLSPRPTFSFLHVLRPPPPPRPPARPLCPTPPTPAPPVDAVNWRTRRH